ncbi:MAG: LysM peptidoglycan-binding domain-containing protein [Myxococcales bacterium]|nr:MAG: LysM peptidoglycan-binding domain-containing protein [Myxococcales bacterium]
MRHTRTELVATCAVLLSFFFADAALAQSDSEEITVADPFGYLEDNQGYDEEGNASKLRATPRELPDTHVVKTGDTLWDVTGHYLGNPWEWPKIWSYNPDITNPHWIYPDYVLHLKGDGASPQVLTLSTGQKVSIKPTRKAGVVYLRNEGFIEKDVLKQAGTLVGADEEQMLLSAYDRVYVTFKEPKYIKPGAEYVIFHTMNKRDRVSGEEGVLVRIYGIVKLEDYDARSKVATGSITEALDPLSVVSWLLR